MPIDAKRIQAVFLAATEIGDPAERAKFLANACEGDAGLRARVEALLRAHDNPDSLLDQPAVAPPDPNAADTLTVPQGTGAPADEDEVPLGFLEPATRPDSLGRIGHFEVLQILGKGGFGIVFRAFDDVLQRVVAIKVMAPQLAATSPARKRFLREARTSAQVRHENVVQVYEVAEHPLPYLAMEFIPGETLQQRLDRTGPLDVPEVLRFGRQIAEGLAAAHANDLIHRDIKPSNVLIEGGPQQRVKITDFGLARAADDASISQSGIIAGTPMYMAPEQALGQTLDQRADLFSLGSVLYQMVAGRPPFRANSTVAVLKRVAEDTPRPIREIIPETPQWLCDIISKLHAKNPVERYQSAREVADVLADCEAQLEAHSQLKDFTLIPEGEPEPEPAPPTIERWKWVAAAVLVCLLLIPVGIILFTKTTSHSDSAQVQKPVYAVLELRFNDMAIHYWVDRHGAMQTGVAVIQLPLEPGEHKVWFSLGDRQFETVSFHLAVGETTELSLEVTPARGQAFLNGKPLEVTTIGGMSADGFTPLFNGTDLTGWANQNPKSWRVERGEIVGTSGADRYVSLVSLRSDYENFHIRAEAKINAGGDSGILFRNIFETGGYEAQINAINPTAFKTGSLALRQKSEKDENWRSIHKVTRSPVPADTWFAYEIIANGSEFTLIVDGKEVVRLTDPTFQRGGIWLEMGASQTVVHFRKIEIKELPASSLPPTFKNSIGMEFVKVPKGKSWLRGGKDILGDQEVVIPADFYLGRYEVTQEEWEKLMGENPSYFSRDGDGLGALKNVNDADLKRFPVENLTWDQCQLFVNKLNKLEKQRQSGWVYRLPKEAEWEYACRGGPMSNQADSAFDYYFAKPTNTLLPKQANFDKALNRTCKVGSYEPNVLGLFDMHGNVAEWCDEHAFVTDLPLGPAIRGGSYDDRPAVNPSVVRHGGQPSQAQKTVGFRLARVPFGDPSPEVKAPPTDPDRRAAEYALSIAGLIRINGERQELRGAAEVPKEPFRLTGVNFYQNKQVTDAGLAHFKDCKNLTYLELARTEVTDAGLVHFKDLKNLTILYLYDTRVTDVGLAHFKDCKNLDALALGGSRVTDAGLAHFRDCKKLTYLVLDNTQVTDAGIRPLESLTGLKVLGLRQTKVTAAGVEELAKALPKCKITWDGGVIEPK